MNQGETESEWIVLAGCLVGVALIVFLVTAAVCGYNLGNHINGVR